jgi:hypothetical protein
LRRRLFLARRMARLGLLPLLIAHRDELTRQ